MPKAKETKQPDEHLPLRVDRKLIRLNRFNPRTKFDQMDLSDIEKSISVDGIQDPILVRPIPQQDGYVYEAVDGDRRLRVAEKLKIAKVDVWVKNMGDTEVLRKGTILNTFRRNISPVEVGRALNTIYKAPEYSMMSLTQFAYKMGFSKGDASRIMALPEKLLPEVQELVAPETKSRRVPEGAIDGRTAYYLTQIPKSERQAEVAKSLAATPKFRGERANRIVKEAQKHPEVPVEEIIEAEATKETKEYKPTITMSLADYEKIKEGAKTTVIVRGDAVQPGLRADTEVTPLLRGESLTIMEVYRRPLSRFKDEDAKRDGCPDLETFKDAWIERYGDWPEEELVSIIQFFSKEQLGK